MKSLLIETENVRKANLLLRRMSTKKGADMTLIYGYPGTGKSQFALKKFAPNNWGYYRIETMDTPKSFLREMYRSLNYQLTGSDTVIRGDGATLAKATIALFQQLSYERENIGNESYVFFIDEVNLAIQHRKWQILELIRDFRDIANAKIIMIGEEDTKERLEKYNAHFFNRCSNFCKFEIPSLTDFVAISLKTMEVEAEKGVYSLLAQKSNGSLHHLEVLIKEFESIATAKNLSFLTAQDVIEFSKED